MGCPEVKFSIYTNYSKNEPVDGKNVGIGLQLNFPKDISVQADFTIDVPVVKFNTTISHHFLESSTERWFCLNRDTIRIGTMGQLDPFLDPYLQLQKAWIDIVIVGTFKIIPKQKNPSSPVNQTVVKEFATEYSLKPDVVIVEGQKIAVLFSFLYI